MKTVDYYKKALGQAEKARELVERAKERYEHDYGLEKGLLASGMVGQPGFDASVKELERKRDEAIEGALSFIDDVAKEYNDEMGELAKLDGSRIDKDTMALLDSGMRLSSKDWQELADAHKDNAIMSRILQERCKANPPEDYKAGNVTFGQSPAERMENFNKFTSLMRHLAKSGAVLDEYADRESYWNHLARESIGRMRPFSDENFDSVNEDFKVEYRQTQTPRVW